MMELNETNGRLSRAERGENCGWHDEEEGNDLEGLPHISQTVDCNTEPTELDDCDEEESVDCNTEPTEPNDCNKEEFGCPRMALRPHVTVVEQGSLISGRLKYMYS